MTEGGIASGKQLLQAIMSGQVARQVRLFAAQGLLPIPREDLFRLQAVLAADPDPELAAAATQSLQGESLPTLIEWIEHHEVEPVVLDMLSRVRSEEAMWSAIAVHAQTSDETMRVLARNGSPLIQDIIMTNQVRLLAHLEILDDLRANPRVSQVVLRRVREFEEEFIEKAISGQLGDAEAQRSSIEEALAALRAIGAHIPNEHLLPYPTTDDDPGVREEVERLGLSTYGRLARMTVKQKIVTALLGLREERTILINSRNRLVVRAVLASPKLTESEIERFAAARSISDEAIRIIASNRRWMQQYGVIQALAQNPKTPLQTALRLLPRLSVRDLSRLARDRNINPVVRRRAQEFHSRRRGGDAPGRGPRCLRGRAGCGRDGTSEGKQVGFHGAWHTGLRCMTRWASSATPPRKRFEPRFGG